MHLESDMNDSAPGHPASRLKGRPSAPPSLWVTLAVDGCMLLVVGALALVDGPWWSFFVPLVPGALVLMRYGQRAAAAMGIRSRDETPHGWLLTFATAGGPAGILAVHAGRYGGFVILTYIALAQIGERIVWARFRTDDDHNARP